MIIQEKLNELFDDMMALKDMERIFELKSAINLAFEKPDEAREVLKKISEIEPEAKQILKEITKRVNDRADLRDFEAWKSGKITEQVFRAAQQARQKHLDEIDLNPTASSQVSISIESSH